MSITTYSFTQKKAFAFILPHVIWNIQKFIISETPSIIKNYEINTCEFISYMIGKYSFMNNSEHVLSFYVVSLRVKICHYSYFYWKYKKMPFIFWYRNWNRNNYWLSALVSLSISNTLRDKFKLFSCFSILMRLSAAKRKSFF